MERQPARATRIIGNTAWLGSSKVIDIALSFVYSVYITRYLGTSLTGKLATGMAWIAVLWVATDIGLGTLLTRDVARERSSDVANRYLVNALLLRFLLALLGYACLVAFMRAFRYPTDIAYTALVLGISGIVLNALSGTFVSLFRAFERMAFDAAWAVVKRILLLLGAYIVVRGGYGLVELVFTYIVVGFVELGYYLWITRQFFLVPRLSALSFSFWPRLIRDGLPLGVSSLLMVIYSKLDTLMLSVLRSSSEVGLYNIALTFRVNLNYIPAVILSALFPAIAAASGSKQMLRMLYAKGFKGFFVMGLPAAVGITLLAGQIVHSLYGSEFGPSVPVLQILIWSIVAYFVQQMFIYAMMATNLSKQCAGLLSLGVILNLGLNALLIPPAGMIGAAVATLIAECIMTLAAYLFLIRQVGYFPIGHSILHSAIGALVMTGFILVLQRLGLSWFFIVPIVALMYCASFVLTGGLSGDERRLLETTFRRVFRLLPGRGA